MKRKLLKAEGLGIQFGGFSLVQMEQAKQLFLTC